MSQRDVAIGFCGGLLASSCCLLQLILNALGVGCAGFAILDDYNVLFLAITAVFLSTSLYSGIRANGRVPRQTIFALLLALSLASMPHLLRIANDNGLSLSRHAAPYSTEPPSVEVHFALTGVKCDACAHRIRSSVGEKFGGIEKVMLQRSENGEGHLTLKVPAQQRDSAVDSVSKLVGEQGFGVAFYGNSRRNQATEPQRSVEEL